MAQAFEEEARQLRASDRKVDEVRALKRRSGDFQKSLLDLNTECEVLFQTANKLELPIQALRARAVSLVSQIKDTRSADAREEEVKLTMLTDLAGAVKFLDAALKVF